MTKSQEQRVEELSRNVGGRFKLTALVQKRIREYHLAGRAFMPSVRNLNELFDLILDQVEAEQIRLVLQEDKELKELPEEEQPAQEKEKKKKAK